MGDSDAKLQNQNNSINVEQYLASLPPGVRFQPTGLELVDYLLKKATESPLPPNRIRNIDVYSCDPDVLIGSLPQVGGKDWYFFSPRNKKYPNGKRPDRATPGGFWKPAGADTNIIDGQGRVVGKKRVLEFYKGPPKGKGKGKGGDGRTNWKMHEYVLPTDAFAAPTNNGKSMLLDKVVLCKIYHYNSRTAEESNLQEQGTTSGSTCEQQEDHPPPLPGFPSACAQGSHFGQPISFGGAMNNVAGSFIQGETNSVLGFYNGKPKERNWSINWNNMPQLDNLGRDAGSNLQGDGSSSINTYTQSSAFSQGGHFRQPISFAPAMDNISGFRSNQYQEPFPSTQHDPGPSNENHQHASFVSGLGVASFTPTTNNIAGSPRGICQESFTSTQRNMGPLQLEPRATWFESTLQPLLETQHYGPVNNNLDQEQTPSLVIGQDIGNNVNQLPFNLDQHSTPLKLGSAYPQGSYDGQSIRFGASTCFSSGLSQQSFDSTQYSPGGPSMDLAGGDAWFGLGQRISTFANEECQDQSHPATQHHVPENSNLYRHRTPSSVTRYYDDSNVNHSQLAVHHNLQSAYHQGSHLTSFAAATRIDNISGYLNELYIDQSLPPTQHYGPETYNLDQEQTPPSVTGRRGDTNFDQLPSDLHHRATPSEARAVEHQLGAPTPEDDYFNALASDLQDPSLSWMVDAFVNQDQNGKS